MPLFLILKITALLPKITFYSLVQTDLSPAFILKILHSAHMVQSIVLKCTAEIFYWVLINLNILFLNYGELAYTCMLCLSTSRGNTFFQYNTDV
jgi:hypothetical protein